MSGCQNYSKKLFQNISFQYWVGGGFYCARNFILEGTLPLRWGRVVKAYSSHKLICRCSPTAWLCTSTAQMHHSVFAFLQLGHNTHTVHNHNIPPYYTDPRVTNELNPIEHQSTQLLFNYWNQLNAYPRVKIWKFNSFKLMFDWYPTSILDFIVPYLVFCVTPLSAYIFRSSTRAIMNFRLLQTCKRESWTLYHDVCTLESPAYFLKKMRRDGGKHCWR